jgi:MFS family permease
MRLVPAEWRDLALVMVTATLVGMTISLAVPLLSLVLEREGVDPFAIGLNTAAMGLGIFLIAPFIDRLVRTLGPVGCMQAALGVAAACMLVFPLWVDPTFWFAVRLVFGAASALLFVLSEAAVNALAPEAIRGRVLGLYATLFSLGFAGGPAVLALAGSEGWAPFLLASVRRWSGGWCPRAGPAAIAWPTPGASPRSRWPGCSATPPWSRPSSRSCRSGRWMPAWASGRRPA